MNEQQKPILLKEITAIKQPSNGTFLTDSTVVIRGTNKCSIFDIVTNKETRVSLDNTTHLSVHPNKQKLALIHQNLIMIHNATTGKKELATAINRYSDASLFNPLNNTLLLWRKRQINALVEYDYQDNFMIDTALNQYNNFLSIAFHPTKQEFIAALGEYGRAYEYEAKKDMFVQKNQLNISTIFYDYSANGSLIAGGSPHNIYTLQSIFDKPVFFPKKDNDEYVYIKMHPNNAALATLSKSYIRYWDVVKHQPFKSVQIISDYYKDFNLTVNPSDESSVQNYKYSDPCLSFSPDGKKLLITLRHKCIVIAVPFEITYNADKKQVGPFVYWMLKNYKIDSQQPLPEDISNYFMHILLATYTR